MEQVNKMLIPAAVAGGVAFAGSHLMGRGDETYTLSMFSDEPFSAPIAIGIVVAISKIAGEFTKDFLLPWVAGDGAIIGLAQFAEPAVIGMTAVGIDALLVQELPTMEEGLNTFLMASVSSMLGDWVGDNFLNVANHSGVSANKQHQTQNLLAVMGR